MADRHDIRLEHLDGAVLLVTLNRPEVRNALSTRLLGEVAGALEEAKQNPDVRAVVLTGGAGVFAAGADLQEIARHTAVSILDDPRVDYWSIIRQFPKPLIAAVNGWCLGGGNELAMHADIIIAGEHARFGQPEINLGIIPGAGGTQRLTHAVGKSFAMRMVLTGEPIDARTALAQGLVAEVTPRELTIERAVELARSIAAKPPLATRLAKEAVIKASELPLAEGLGHERRAFCLLFASEDKKEGVTAFLEKRRPRFQGI